MKFTAVTTIVVLALTGLYYFLVGDYEKTFLFFSAACAAGGTIVTAFYSARTLRLYISNESRIRERECAIDVQGMKERAMRYGERWNDPQMYHVREVCRSLLEARGKPQPELDALIESKKTNVIHIFNFLEEVAFGLQQEVIDEEIVRLQFEGIIIGLWQTLDHWISKHRADRGRPKIWNGVEDIYKKWK